MKVAICLAAVAAWQVAAAPVDERQAGPSVTIASGTVIGSSSLNVDSFKGIPFAQPPVGNLRLKPPQPLTQGFGTLMATGTPRACPQFIQQINTTSLPAEVVTSVLNSPLGQVVSNSGEDCLTLNVQRPSGTTANSALPVLAWIYGGGFESGSTQNNDGANFVSMSVTLGKPVLYVQMNYRLNGYGFLGGKELSAEGSTNLGLRDQRLALQWIQDNIAAFGGDPTKVTLWGESVSWLLQFIHQ